MRIPSRRLLAAAALAVAAVPGTAQAGCVQNLLRSDSPSIEVVRFNPDGSITIDPHGADAFVGSTQGTAQAFVTCVV